MNKILITIKGRTLILYYQIKQGSKDSKSGLSAYVSVLPSDELARFDLQGLSPEMFCVNIADMVNIRGQYSGQVENEKQIPVAKWEMNYEAYLLMRSTSPTNLSHQQVVKLVSAMPQYIGESEGQYIDIEEKVMPCSSKQQDIYSGYRLTIVTEEIEGEISSYAYYNLDTCNAAEWQNIPPPKEDVQTIKNALNKKLQAMKDAGLTLTRVLDETDYAILTAD